MLHFLVPQAYAQCVTNEDGSIALDTCLSVTANGQQRPISEVFSTPAVLINLVVRNLFVIAGAVLFMLVIYAGFLFITGGAKGKDQAKDVLTTGFIGLVVMMAAFWILQIVKVVTGIGYLGI